MLFDKTMQDDSSDNIPNTFFEQLAPIENDLFGFIKIRLDNNHHDAEEVFQSVLFKGWNSMHQQRFPGKFTSWVYRIAHNTLTDFIKDRITSRTGEKEYQEHVKGDFGKKAEYEEERTALAWEIFNSLPGDLREVYYLRHVSDMKIREIADVIGKSERTTRERLDRAQEIVSGKAEKFIAGSIVAGIGSQQVHALVMQIQAKAMELYPEAAWIGASATTTGAGTGLATAAETAKQSFFGLCAAIALPFLWIMSLLIGTQFCGAAFVYNAPTLRARRWIVKHLLFCYCGIVAYVVLAYSLNKIVFDFAGSQYGHRLASVTNWLVSGSVLLYIAWLRDSYVKILSPPADRPGRSERQITYQWLRKCNLFSFCGTTGILAFFFLWFFFTVIRAHSSHFSADTNAVEVVIYMTILFCCFAAIFHVGTFLRFREFIERCKDEAVFQETAPDSEQMPRVRNISTILLLIFAVFTLIPGVLHLVLQIGIRPLSSIFEVAVFGTLWIMLFRYNMKYRDNKEFRIVVMFLVQLLIMQIVRGFVYL